MRVGLAIIVLLVAGSASPDSDGAGADAVRQLERAFAEDAALRDAVGANLDASIRLAANTVARHEADALSLSQLRRDQVAAIDAVEEVGLALAVDAEILRDLHGDLPRLRAEAAAVVVRYETARDALLDAADTWRRAASALGEAAGSLARAEAYFREAERDYRLAGAAVLVLVGQGVCATRTTPAEMRRTLEERGRDLTGQQIHHAWPDSWGGIPHPWNLIPLDASRNASIGNRFPEVFLEAPLPFLTGALATVLGALGGCVE